MAGENLVHCSHRAWHWHLGTSRTLHTNFGSPSAQVCNTYLASLSQNSDWTGREGAEDRCRVDLQAMEEHTSSVGDMLDELEWLSEQNRREQNFIVN